MIYRHSNRLLMDRISRYRQETFKKCGSDRLRAKLIDAGHDSANGPTQGDMAGEIRIRELALEEKRLDAEQKKFWRRRG